MEEGLIRFLPLVLLMAFLAVCAVLIWRGQYKAGAYIVQVAFAAFLSGALGMALYVMSVVMVTTWLFAGSSTFLMIDAVVTQSIGATLGFIIVKKYGTATGRLNLLEILASLALAIAGSTVGFLLFKDATFAADFVTNANSVAGAFFGAVIMANSPLIVIGMVRVLQNHEP